MPQQTHWEDHRRPFETGNVDQNTPVVLVLLQPWIRCSLHLLYYVYMGERTEPRSNYKMLTNVEAQARLWRLVGNVQSLFPLVETSAKCQGLQARWHCHSFKALVEHHTKDQVLQIARLGHSMGPRGRQLTQMFNSQCFPCFAWPMFVPILSGSIPKFFKSSSSSVRKLFFAGKKITCPDSMFIMFIIPVFPQIPPRHPQRWMSPFWRANALRAAQEVFKGQGLHLWFDMVWPWDGHIIWAIRGGP